MRLFGVFKTTIQLLNRYNFSFSPLHSCRSRPVHRTIFSFSLYQKTLCALCDFHYKSKTKMSSVSVKNFQDDERLHIHLQLSLDPKTPSLSPDGAASKSLVKFTLSRMKTEELKFAIERLRINLNKKQSKKTKSKKAKKQNSETPSLKETEEDLSNEIPIKVLHHGVILDDTVLNETAWVEGALLKVGDQEIPMIYNLPGVKLEKLPQRILEGFPLYPAAEFEFTTQDQCEFYWKTFEKENTDKVKLQISRESVDLDGTFQASSFTPQPDDVGKYLLLACVPKQGEIRGKVEAVVSPWAIAEGPGSCPFEARHEHTKHHAEYSCFRVMTYNILAEVYSDTEFSRDHLFNYCPYDALQMDYRKHLLLKEIIGYKADLLCLQEVDKHIFSSHLLPALSTLGYTGLFMGKARQVSEGCASFVRQDKFRILNSHDIVLSEFLSSDPLCADIWDEVSKVEPLRECIMERSSVLQMTAVERVDQPNRVVCLCNTHLYFHPTACNVRLILAAAALRHIQAVCDAYTLEGKTAAMVFCGDFNSAPHLAVYQLMTSQLVPSDHVDWASAGEEQLLTSLELCQPMNILSACGTPSYTNYTSGFQATLDYVFINADLLEVAKVVPLPSHEEVTANIALPNRVFPSDHLALVCDLKFR
ncbi:hypothetical protein EGW08_007371 [Elysia chlorotica]|uniref:2',5'-phosphodiesterase 12 n=1 Tax=Elysia chlorotica TaxID=188477 RepID=A0A3S1BC91_ELYCH|nr:hypothetical protein EGW08_007371 [Elysia chlorotica]